MRRQDPMRPARWWPILLLGLMVLPSVLAAADGRDPVATETISRVKAAYLYNFTKFVSWPRQAFGADTQPLVIGIVDGGGSGVAALVAEELAGKSTPAGRPIVVQTFTTPTAAAQAHILFVTADSGFDAAATRAALAGRPVLVVGESAGFAEHGGVINFAVTGDTVRCEINLRSAERASLKLSSRLASVARLVRDETDVP